MLIVLASPPDHKQIPSFITVYRPVAGWKSVQYWWNLEEGGFWEPWQTAAYAFNTEEQAIADGLIWAEAEGIPFYLEGYAHKLPDHMSESPDYDPAQKSN